MKTTLFSLWLILVMGCVSYQDHYTLTETIEAKVMAESLLKRTTTSFHENSADVTNFQNHIQKMLLYQGTRKNNKIMLSMWQLMADEKASIQQWLALWEEKGSLSPAFSEEYLQQIRPMFDLMIDYESKKDQKSESAILQLLQTALQ